MYFTAKPNPKGMRNFQENSGRFCGGGTEPSLFSDLERLGGGWEWLFCRRGGEGFLSLRRGGLSSLGDGRLSCGFSGRSRSLEDDTRLFVEVRQPG